MMPGELVGTVNRVRSALLAAIEPLAAAASFEALRRSVPAVEAAWSAILACARSPRLEQPCDGRLTCAVIPADAGQNAVLAELFPDLVRRGWLRPDGASIQALRIRDAAGEADSDEAILRCWDVAGLKALFDHPDVADRNRRDHVRVSYSEDGVGVDGSADPAAIGPERLDLVPPARPLRLPPTRLKDQEVSLDHEGRRYDAVALRLLVREIELNTPFGFTTTPCPVSFVLAPALRVNASAGDGVLRHAMAHKGRHVAAQLGRADELDFVVHLVRCGDTTPFATLWQTLTQECGSAATRALSERLIVALTDSHRYFTDRDIRTRYEDPAIARHAGDHFAATVEENVLQRLSPHGSVRPAQIVFLNSRTAVEEATGESYDQAYGRFRPIMTGWLQPQAVGHDTLARLGLLDDFRDNVAALADPADRGQGFLIRRILALAAAKGPARLLEKTLIHSGLLAALRRLLELLTLYYDPQGRLSPEAVFSTAGAAFGCFDPAEPRAIEDFAERRLDPAIDTLIPNSGSAGADWVREAFQRLCGLIGKCLAEADGSATGDLVRRFDLQAGVWAERWGYAGACLPPPVRGGSAELLVHCLKLHAREMLYQLTQTPTDRPVGIEQDEADRQQILALTERLQDAATAALAACRQYGVQT